MKKSVYLSLFVLIIISFSACQYEKSNRDTKRLEQLDNLLSVQPEAVLDSLKQINPLQLNKYNKAYYQLIEVIANDKISYNFTSDSLINSAVSTLSTNSSKHPKNYARALMYQGIVRFRMNITDSTAYQPLKDALNLFKHLAPAELKDQYFCLYYLGEIHETNDNGALAGSYYTNSVQLAKLLNDSGYLYSSYSGLFWVSLRKSDYNSAGHYLDTLSSYSLAGDEYRISLKNMHSAYFQYTGQYTKAIELEKQIFRIKTNAGYQNNLISNYYTISKIYRDINKPDSALKYARLSIKAIRDTSYHLNYFYYLNLAMIAERTANWKLSAEAYKKTYELIDQSIDKNMDTKILELEKKYDLTESENKTLHFRNRTIILSAIILLMVLVIIILTQHSKRQKQVKILTEQRNKALEYENERKEQELIKKKLILSFFQQVSVQNLEIKNLLYDLKVNSSITKNINVYNKVSEEYDKYNRKSKITETETFSDDILIKLTGISEDNARKLNKSEKLMLLLISLDAGNREMSVLFNTSVESIRSRKLKLKKKIEQLNIQIIKDIG